MENPATRRQLSGRPLRAESGFSLLEVLVAFSILALSLGTLMQIFSKGLELASMGDRYSRALVLAESTLATIGYTQPIETGESSGAFDNVYDWSIKIQPHNLEDLDPSSLDLSLYQVQVMVAWENRRVFLETLRFGPGT
ncbi:MAG: prepilin-type N-terminal cleavage/methylation domain-containing protein [Methylococcales bacterium]|nr:prepilin-type N-terminal cleavage/methylation domain-containing protein [Methylococcales bacterium]